MIVHHLIAFGKKHRSLKTPARAAQLVVAIVIKYAMNMITYPVRHAFPVTLTTRKAERISKSTAICQKVRRTEIAMHA